MNSHYLYGSFLPYFESLHMARWLTRLCDLSRRLRKLGPISENIADAAAHSARIFNPEIRPAGTSSTKFTEMCDRENKLKAMNAEEKESFYQQEWAEVEAKISSGEIDIWDDTPTFVERTDVERFLQDSLEYLRRKVCTAANPQASFLEAMILRTVDCLEEQQKNPSITNKVRGCQCLLILWDTARMKHEGRPPYQIKFSAQVAEALGIDPVVEESRLATEYSLPDSFVRHGLVAAKLARLHLPEYPQEIAGLVKNLRQTKNKE